MATRSVQTAAPEVAILRSGVEGVRHLTSKIETPSVSNGSFTLGPVSTSQGACGVAAGVVTCTLGMILPGAAVRVDVAIGSTEGVDVNDIARVTSATPDPDASNNEAAAGVSFYGSADLVMTKTGPASVLLDGTFVYTVTVDNLGPSTAGGVVVTDVLPAGVAYVSAVASVAPLPSSTGRSRGRWARSPWPTRRGRCRSRCTCCRRPARPSSTMPR